MTRARELARDLERAERLSTPTLMVVIAESAALLIAQAERIKTLEAVREAAETLCENSPPCGNWRHPELRAAVDAAKD